MTAMNSDYMLSPKYLSRISFLKERCHQKRVMHLGCSSGRYINDRMQKGNFLHAILGEESSDLYGLDIDAKSIDVMREMGFDNLYTGDVENLEEVRLDIKFDVVVAGDLLEHLTKPGAMLEGVHRLLGPKGVFIVSTNNAFGLHYQIRRWLGRYTEHFEHVCFFSPETLVHLFERHGYTVQEMYGAYTVPPYTWKQKLLFSTGKPLFSFAPVLAGTLIVVASLAG